MPQWGKRYRLPSCTFLSPLSTKKMDWLISFGKENFDLINLAVGFIGVIVAIIALIVEIKAKKRKKAKAKEKEKEKEKKDEEGLNAQKGK